MSITYSSLAYRVGCTLALNVVMAIAVYVVGASVPCCLAQAGPADLTGRSPISGQEESAAQIQFDQAMKALQAGDVEHAGLSLQAIASSHPTYSSPLFNLGLIEQSQGRHDLAVSHFLGALSRAPNSAPIYSSLGISYRMLGQFKDAEKAYQAAISLDFNYALAHLNLAILYDVYLQQLNNALSEYEIYQGLLENPDPKVSTWIKDIRARAITAAATHPSRGDQP